MKKEDGTSEYDSITRALSNIAGRNHPAINQQREELEAKLEIPPLPEEFGFAWGSFLDLQSARTSNGFGPEPLLFTEIESYLRLTGRFLLPDEIRAIKIIDVAYLGANAELQRQAKATKEATDKSSPKTAPVRTKKRG